MWVFLFSNGLLINGLHTAPVPPQQLHSSQPIWRYPHPSLTLKMTPPPIPVTYLLSHSVPSPSKTLPQPWSKPQPLSPTQSLPLLCSHSFHLHFCHGMLPSWELHTHLFLPQPGLTDSDMSEITPHSYILEIFPTVSLVGLLTATAADCVPFLGLLAC